MIFEIMTDISAFVTILFIALLAYSQIIISITDSDDIDANLRESYVLAFGELGSFAEASLMQFIIFVIFSFFIPLVLMNILIAIMSDAYERV